MGVIAVVHEDRRVEDRRVEYVELATGGAVLHLEGGVTLTAGSRSLLGVRIAGITYRWSTALGAFRPAFMVAPWRSMPLPRRAA